MKDERRKRARERFSILIKKNNKNFIFHIQLNIKHCYIQFSIEYIQCHIHSNLKSQNRIKERKKIINALVGWYDIENDG